MEQQSASATCPSADNSQATGTKQSDITIPTSTETNDCNTNQQPLQPKTDTNLTDSNNKENNNEDGDKNNESSTLSTAFTISFEDDNNVNKSSSLKRFGIRDSIRKFAPPKPHTIEKPREPKSRGQDQGQDNSLASIESAPANMSSKHSSPSHQYQSNRDRSNSSRASSKKSNSSRHSNISESAAFLIDKMLNQNNSKPSAPSAEKLRHLQQRGAGGGKNLKSDMLESEVDFWEDKSDNGTYIVGADPESEAARKKIDELFGVYKAAEASLLAKKNQRSPGQQANAQPASSRQSRPTDKKPMSRERIEHINRLAYRKSPASRSSSSSRQDGNPPETRRHNSRNSSCDRIPGPIASSKTAHHSSSGHAPRPRRSASQSSRQSSHKEISDGDTRSSRSSLQNIETEVARQDQASSLSSQPSMKFNRAFALRRARLGLGEPPISGRLTSTPNYPQVPTSSNRSNSNSTSAGFCRDDGGRFSLRMRNSVVPSSRSSGRSSQHHQNSSGGQLVDSYISKLSRPGGGQQSVSSTSMTNSSAPQYSYQPASLATTTMTNSSNHSSTTPTSLPYQLTTADDLLSLQPHDTMSPTRQRMLAARLARRGNNQRPVGEIDDSNDRVNFSLGASVAADSSDLYNNFNVVDSRNCSSASGRRVQGNNSSLQLGALDSLVISAISGLSLKIRQSVCDILVEQAKKLPAENETRLIVEEILPQLTADSSRCKSPTSMEEIDQSLYFDLARTLKNLKKVEQMVDVINLISKDITTRSSSTSNLTNATHSQVTGTQMKSSESASEVNSLNDLSPV